MKHTRNSVLFLVAIALGTSVSAPRNDLYAQASAGEFSIRMFVPASATTWWAVLSTNAYHVVRTTDAGRSWQDVTPNTIAKAWFFLGNDLGWVWAASNEVYRTTDGGRSWKRMGPLPEVNVCELDFVDSLHGWCADIGPASPGSEAVLLYRTVDGGASWALVSETSGAGPSTPESIPLPCDKAINFTSPNIGWGSMVCNGADPSYPLLYSSKDGGRTWHARHVPFPPCKTDRFLPSPWLDSPVLKGSWVGLRIRVDGCDARTAVGISTSTDGGTTWRTQSVPMVPTRTSSAALLDSVHWRLTDGAAIVATDDGGQHWQNWPLPEAMRGQAFDLHFLSPLLGWAVPVAAVGARTTVWQTSDGGKTWRSLDVVI